MPSTSGKQARTMAADAHDPAFARKVGIPQTVAREYSHADHLRDMHRAAKSSPTMRSAVPGGKRRAE